MHDPIDFVQMGHNYYFILTVHIWSIYVNIWIVNPLGAKYVYNLSY